MSVRGRIQDFFQINQAIDQDAPGHYARVFEGSAPELGISKAAFKIMRSEHLPTPTSDDRFWYFESFAMEAEILTRLEAAGVKGLSPLLACGYLQPDTPVDDDTQQLGRGDFIHFTHQELQGFKSSLHEKFNQRWLPYLILEQRQPPCLLVTARRYFRFGDGLRMPILELFPFVYQALDLLAASHRNSVIYQDFKLAHFYWDGTDMQVIDWNSSRLVDPGTPSRDVAVARAKDIHDFAAGTLYPLLSGRPINGLTWDADPSPVRRVETRYDNYDRAVWDERDDHIGNGLKNLVGQALRGDIPDVDAMRGRLQSVEDEEWGSFTRLDDLSICKTILLGAIQKIRQAQTLDRDKQLEDVRFLYQEAESDLVVVLNRLSNQGEAIYLETERMLRTLSRELVNNSLSRVIP